jgi:hypothetical protein
MRELREHGQPAAFLEIRYEELLDCPEPVLGKVFAFLGERFEASVLEFHRNASPYETDVTNAVNLHRPLLAENKHKWRGEMSARDLALFEAVAGDELVRCGYELACAPRELGRAEALWRALAQHPPRLAARLRDRQGQREALHRLRVRWRLTRERILGQQQAVPRAQ